MPTTLQTRTLSRDEKPRIWGREDSFATRHSKSVSLKTTDSEMTLLRWESHTWGTPCEVRSYSKNWAQSRILLELRCPRTVGHRPFQFTLSTPTMSSSSLHILQHKSWHVWKHDNVEKVKRDEAEHAKQQAALRKEQIQRVFPPLIDSSSS